MINDFLVDVDERAPYRCWSMTSLSMMINEFLFYDDQGVPCRWSVTSSSMMINYFLVDDDQWLPCRWWSTSSFSTMIKEFLVDDQWLPRRWWSITSLSMMIEELLVDDDQLLPFRWWCHVFYQSLIMLQNVCSSYAASDNLADVNSFVVISDCPDTSLCLSTNWYLIIFPVPYWDVKVDPPTYLPLGGLYAFVSL
jgi:hypothetical protein